MRYEYKRKKHLSKLLLVFVFMLTVSSVYAAAAGVLNFNGFVSLGADLELRIVREVYSPGVPPLSNGYMEVSPDGQTAAITANLVFPGDTLTFAFHVENTGSVAAKIIAVVVDSDAPILLSGNFNDLENDLLAVGASTSTRSIVVGWDITSMYDDAKDDFEFTITINYSINL
jgi:hypothetical protein